MDELEQNHEELRTDVDQLKEQMAKILEALQALEKKNTNEVTSAANEEQPTTPSHPPGFTPMPVQLQGNNPQGTMVPLTMYSNKPSIANLQDAHVQFPPYGLPPGYTPPMAMNPPDNNPQTSAPQNPPQSQGPCQTTTEIPQTQSPSPVFMPYNLPPGHAQPITNSQETGAPVGPPMSNPQNANQMQFFHPNTHSQAPAFTPPTYPEDSLSKEK